MTAPRFSIRPEEFAGLDFGVGVVRGARSFRITDDGFLAGIVYHQIWTVGENLAICRKAETFIPQPYYTINGVLHTTPTPDTRYQTFAHTMANCLHGFYAYYDGSNDFRTGPTYCPAVIEGYGEVLIGTRGFRAMKARIVALQPTDERGIDAVVTHYPDIPRFDQFEQMVSEFPPDIPERKIA
jgi:hypothetical protein